MAINERRERGGLHISQTILQLSVGLLKYPNAIL